MADYDHYWHEILDGVMIMQELSQEGNLENQEGEENLNEELQQQAGIGLQFADLAAGIGNLGLNVHTLAGLLPVQGRFPVVRLSHLPPGCTSQNVRLFYVGLHIIDIFRSSLTGYILLFPDERVASESIARNGPNAKLSTRAQYHQDVRTTQGYPTEEAQFHAQFPTVRVRGLPYTISFLDVMIFFAPLRVVDVVIRTAVNHWFARGEASMIFADAGLALERTAQYLHNRYLEVFSVNRAIYYRVVASLSPQ